MGTISVSSITNGSSLDATVVSNNFSTVVNEFNGNIDNNNIKAGAAIATNKLASEAWTTWTPGYTGYSVAPTPSVAKYFQLGKLVFLILEHSAYGTSNATTLTITGLPVATKNAQTLIGGRVRDNGGYSTTIGTLISTAGSTTLTAFRDMTGTAWTNTNGKGLDFTIVYEAN